MKYLDMHLCYRNKKFKSEYSLFTTRANWSELLF